MYVTQWLTLFSNHILFGVKLNQACLFFGCIISFLCLYIPNFQGDVSNASSASLRSE